MLLPIRCVAGHVFGTAHFQQEYREQLLALYVVTAAAAIAVAVYGSGGGGILLLLLLFSFL